MNKEKIIKLLKRHELMLEKKRPQDLYIDATYHMLCAIKAYDNKMFADKASYDVSAKMFEEKYGTFSYATFVDTSFEHHIASCYIALARITLHNEVTFESTKPSPYYRLSFNECLEYIFPLGFHYTDGNSSLEQFEYFCNEKNINFFYYTEILIKYLVRRDMIVPMGAVSNTKLLKHRT
jgi:hypothetical protein